MRGWLVSLYRVWGKNKKEDDGMCNRCGMEGYGVICVKDRSFHEILCKNCIQHLILKGEIMLLPEKIDRYNAYKRASKE